MSRLSGLSGETKSIRSALSVHPSLPDGEVDEMEEEPYAFSHVNEEDETGSQYVGDGETVSCEELLRTTDWSKTPLGPVRAACYFGWLL